MTWGRSTPLQRRTPLKRLTPLAASGKSDTAQIKRDIQAELRRIVIARDGGCIFRSLGGGYGVVADFSIPHCNGYDKNNNLILQADHLITRASSATYADSRLVVCVCKGHHAWKSLGTRGEKLQYDAIVRTLLPPDRVALWDVCERDSWRPRRTSTTDWALELAYLRTL